MVGSRVSAFSELDDFEAALGEGGIAELLVIGCGQFRARMTRIVLPHLRLSSIEELLPRIAFVSPPPGVVRILLPIRRAVFPVYGGMRIEAGEIITHSHGEGVHERLDAPCHWSDILLPMPYLARYGRALAGTLFALPPGPRKWRPTPEALRRMTALHDAAIRVIKARPRMSVGTEAAHGLEQELLDGLIECLSGRPEDARTGSARRHAEIMARFEEVRRAHADRNLPVAEICAALGVSSRTLRACCEEHLGMAPSRYLHARRMQLVRRALRRADPSETSVSRTARRYGFGEPGRFAAAYRALFGELPSATLKG